MVSLLRNARASAKKFLRSRAGPQSLKEVNTLFVDILKTRMPYDEAMQHAIGGAFEEMGRKELALLQHYGLAADGYLIDVGCGAGRLAQPLSQYLRGRYLGTDLVPDLIAHARKLTGRKDWRFEIVDHIGIPEQDGAADMVCFFSVLTHLRHEQSFWYLEEAKRVLKPGGIVVFSFLEFREASHMEAFWHALKVAKHQATAPLNVFVDRDGIRRWAEALAMDVIDIRVGSEAVVPEGALGQSHCVLRKAA